MYRPAKHSGLQNRPAEQSVGCTTNMPAPRTPHRTTSAGTRGVTCPQVEPTSVGYSLGLLARLPLATFRRVGTYSNPPLEGRPLEVGRSIPTHPTDSASQPQRGETHQPRACPPRRGAADSQAKQAASPPQTPIRSLPLKLAANVSIPAQRRSAPRPSLLAPFRSR